MSDRELLSRVQQLVRDERHATAVLVAHLCELERRSLYLQEGCRSLFTYCVQVLHLSEHEAYCRIEVARVALRIPAVLTHLAAGHVHLTGLGLLGPLLTAENHAELLAAAKHKSKREIETLIATLRPRPDVAACVRKLPAKKPDEQVVPTPGDGGMAAQRGLDGISQPAAEPGSDPAARAADGETRAGCEHHSVGADAPGIPEAPRIADAPPASDAPRIPDAPRPQRPTAPVVPLAPARYKVQFTASAATCEKLHRAQELLRHRFPDGDIAAVIDQALEVLVQDLERKKFAATRRPARPNAAADGPRRAGTEGAGREKSAMESVEDAAAEVPQNATVERRETSGAEVQQDSAGMRPEDSMEVPQNSTPERRENSMATSRRGSSVAREAHSRYIPAAVKRAVWERDGGRCTFVSTNGLRCGERGQLEFDHVHPHADGGNATAENLRLLCRRHNQHAAALYFGVWQADGVSQAESHTASAPASRAAMAQ